MAGLQQVLAQPTHYSRDIFLTVKVKPMNKVMMTPLAMMSTNVLTHFLIWMVMERKQGWMSTSPTQRMPQDHEVSLLNPLSQIWRISQEDAKRTINTTTQMSV